MFLPAVKVKFPACLKEDIVNASSVRRRSKVSGEEPHYFKKLRLKKDKMGLGLARFPLPMGFQKREPGSWRKAFSSWVESLPRISFRWG